MKAFIITGASRGIRQAIAELLAAEDHRLFCISRKANAGWAGKHPRIRSIEFDLTRTDELDSLMESIVSSIEPLQPEMIGLINSAGVVAPLADIGHCSAGEMTTNVQVNLLAPMIMTSSFIRRTGHLPALKRILNVSSGSARYLCPGMSCYSAAKSGLETFTRAVALEQGDNGVKIVAAWPGLVDTALQEEARTASAERFAAASEFSRYKDKGLLKTPNEVAERLIRLFMSESFGQTPVVEDLDAI